MGWPFQLKMHTLHTPAYAHTPQYKHIHNTTTTRNGAKHCAIINKQLGAVQQLPPGLLVPLPLPLVVVLATAGSSAPSLTRADTRLDSLLRVLQPPTDQGGGLTGAPDE
jgi:hypothetical protein